MARKSSDRGAGRCDPLQLADADTMGRHIVQVVDQTTDSLVAAGSIVAAEPSFVASDPSSLKNFSAEAAASILGNANTRICLKGPDDDPAD